MSETDGIVKVHFGPSQEQPADPGQGPPPLDLFYGIQGGVLSFGFSADAVRARLAPAAAGQSLRDGTDFAKVVSHLDADPKGMFYLNLPKLQEMIGQSQMVKGMLASQAEMQPVMELVLDPEMASSGIGWSTVETDGGVRQVTFGPSWIGSGVATTGIVAAIAIPNLLNAIDRGRSKRTMADMRSIATAVEAFRVDNDVYPSSEGWVEVRVIAEQLSPMYIQNMPASDGWGHAMLFWSDGAHFRLVSPGKGGELDRPWDGDLESTTTTDFSSDIVYSDGAFMIYPAGN
jgi:general secretion pathway protein G